MTETLQTFLSTAIPQAAAELETALLRLPEDKRSWSPMGKARTALDMIAECAMLNDVTEIVQSKQFPADFDMTEYSRVKDELQQDWEKLRPMLHDSVARTVAAIEKVPDAELEIKIDFPWGPMSVAEVIAYPYWNMKYHEGQINYIASMLGCLD